MRVRPALSTIALTWCLLAAGCASSAVVPGQPASSTSTASTSTASTSTASTSTASNMNMPWTTLSPPGDNGVTITLTGVASAGVEAGCVLLGDYLLLGGPRDLLLGGDQLAVVGRPNSDLMSTCQQGIPLQVESAQIAAPTTG